MHNSYISSAVFSLRAKGSLSFSFNDYSNLLNARFEKSSLSLSPCCCSCCSCCFCCTSLASCRLPINPRFLYGLRQSTLIQCSPSRRLILGGGDRYLYRYPACDLDEHSYDCSFRKRNVSPSDRRRRKGKIRSMFSEERTERYSLGRADDAEAVISLLSEQVSEERWTSRERSKSSFKRVELEKKSYDSKYNCKEKKKAKVEKSCGSYSKNKKVVEVEDKGNYGIECYGRKKENVGSVSLESDSKCEYESVRVESREEGYRRNEGREASLRGESHRGRTQNSSCSSYYSLSSSGDFESDTEQLNEEHQFVEEPLSEYRQESTRNEDSRTERQAAEEFKRHGHDAEDAKEVLGQRSDIRGSSVHWDLRKKSEKKLAEASIEERQSREKSSQVRSTTSKANKTDYVKRLSSHKQLDEGKNSTLAVNLNQQTRKQHAQIDNRVIGESETRRLLQDFTEISKSQGSDTGKTSQSQKLYSDRDENLIVAVNSDWERTEHHKTGGPIAEKEDFRTGTRKASEALKIHDDASERISTLDKHSASRMEIREEDKTLVQSSVKHQQRDQESISRQLDLRRKSESLSKISAIHDTNSRKISVLKSESGMKKQEENSTLISASGSVAKGQSPLLDEETHQRFLPKKGSQDVTDMSINYSSNVEIVANSQRTSRNEIIEKDNGTDETVKQIQSKRDAQKPGSLSSSHEKADKASSFQASLTLVSQAREEQTDVETEKRRPQAVLMPPTSQLVHRGSPYKKPVTGTVTHEASVETSEGVSSALHTHLGGRTTSADHEAYAREEKDHITHEGSLDSVHRLEETSLHFVGEFVEKAGQEIFTSEIQKAQKTCESDKHGQNISGRYDKDLKMKEHDSRRSSGGSGAKGPSDEMWDVAEPSVQDHSEAEVAEGTSTAGNAVIKRTGRSLWSLIADIVRLRWNSQAQTPSSAVRSGGRTSPIESAGSETWFSGREPDDNSEENLRRERSSKADDATSYQLELGRTLTQGQGEVSITMSSKGALRQLEGNNSSPSNTSEIVSASEGLSSTSVNENPDGNSFQSAPSGGEGQPLVPLPARSIRSPVTEEISEGGRVTEISGPQGKSGELKQRKLQRTKQVLRDRFDEWEEAYQLKIEQQKVDEIFMREALLEAKKAADTWEVPVGAVLVQHGQIIARGCNLVEELRDSTAHAEMLCIREASNLLRSWRLADTTLYVTLEPCPMCAGAILQARIDTLVWGAPNKLLGADGSWIRLFPDGGEGGNASQLTDKPAAPVHPFHPKMTIRRGVLEAECADVMQQFFQLRRKKKAKSDEPPPQPSCIPIANHPSKILTKMHDIFHFMFCL